MVQYILLKQNVMKPEPIESQRNLIRQKQLGMVGSSRCSMRTGVPLTSNLNQSLVLLAFIVTGSAVEANVFIICYVFLCWGGTNVAVLTSVSFLRYLANSAGVALALPFHWDLFT